MCGLLEARVTTYSGPIRRQKTAKIAIFAFPQPDLAKSRALFQVVGGQIRYSAEQWNFSAYQRILDGLTME
jgi:hypothetical protein